MNHETPCFQLLMGGKRLGRKLGRRALMAAIASAADSRLDARLLSSYHPGYVLICIRGLWMLASLSEPGIRRKRNFAGMIALHNQGRDSLPQLPCRPC
jgi:hypothetical protein